MDDPVPHAAACACDRCKRNDVQAKALDLVRSRLLLFDRPKGKESSENPLLAVIRSLDAAKSNHAKVREEVEATAEARTVESFLTLRRPKDCSDANDEEESTMLDPWVFFPKDFKRFLLTGTFPRIARGRGENIPRPYSALPPVIVVGCGRSGTTLLASLLAEIVPGAVFLNEPRVLWLNVIPSIDVWSTKADARRGRLTLDASDVPDAAADILRGYHSDVLRTAARVQLSKVPTLLDDSVESVKEETPLFVLEKFPEHVHKIPALRKVYPRAKFIHVVRDGRSVARSIGGFQEHDWFGANGRKWHSLRSLAARDMGVSDARIDALCAQKGRADLSRRGLIEWGLAVRAADVAAKTEWANPETRKRHFMEVKYEGIVRDSDRTLRSVLAFVAPGADDRVTRELISRARRKVNPSHRSVYSASKDAVSVADLQEPLAKWVASALSSKGYEA